MAANHSEQVSTYLPLHVIEIILLNLPAKSLLRFKAVSKSWNTMISDPVFIRNHLHQSKASNSQNLFLCKLIFRYNSKKFCLVKIDEDRILRCLEALKSPRGFNTRVLCYCDGVLLFKSDEETRSGVEFVLWNPSTRTQTIFRLPFELNTDLKCYGLCHDPRIGDFKAVVIFWNHYAVYSCKNKAWTRKKYFGDTFRVAYRPGVFVDGVVYWLKMEKKRRCKLTYFDPKDDEFKMRNDEHAIFGVQGPIYMIDFGGRLCMYYYEARDKVVHIWIKGKGLDNNSWKELITIENVERFASDFVPMCFVENKIVVRLDGTTVVVYNPSEKTFEEFEDTTHYFDFLSAPYVESLISPNTFFRPKRKRNCL
ncbi:PREDICTED: F-box/kelch-repeat protein At3g23880-like [Erythranthe guttata]|uniref:F-box/kelch-repeat protein At3g23880-like n=1 Tax=Erythranthe guttata TaxID=4155 RepID=UPI00064E0169|nr:PREDICTED: F-box/kelch-repeat protein At3g23880-like [Erythranthe guttata]|eukprot:XP_012833480.1 PREDICTED: F-box/kelch-repeat protein At3g23880-like [Erythranthe guttata]